MQRRLCEMSEAKWSITEAKCLQISHNKYASQRDAISHSMGNLMLSHSAGMHNTDKSIAGICPNKFERAKGSKRFHFASLHYIFSAYLPTHIKSLRNFIASSSGQLVYHFQKKIGTAWWWGNPDFRVFKEMYVKSYILCARKINRFLRQLRSHPFRG